MLKKLVTGILSLALCASALAALPQTAYADEADPTPIVTVEPGETVESEEPVKLEEPLECMSAFPDIPDCEVTE